MAVNLMKFVHYLQKLALLPRTHGSGLFTRGQTQAFSICTLGALGDVQILDGLGIEEDKTFYASL